MGGWSVMVMILCVYKWSQILVSVCVQVRLNVYKWSLCTSDPFLCVQVIPLPYRATCSRVIGAWTQIFPAGFATFLRTHKNFDSKNKLKQSRNKMGTEASPDDLRSSWIGMANHKPPSPLPFKETSSPCWSSVSWSCKMLEDLLETNDKERHHDIS